MAKKITLAPVAAQMEKSFAAAASDISDIKRDMATKDDLAKFATKQDVRSIVEAKINPVVGELRSIRTELKELSAKVENVIGFRKEIDHALERIPAIEKHLGIDKKIAA